MSFIYRVQIHCHKDGSICENEYNNYSSAMEEFQEDCSIFLTFSCTISLSRRWEDGNYKTLYLANFVDMDDAK